MYQFYFFLIKTIVWFSIYLITNYWCLISIIIHHFLPNFDIGYYYYMIFLIFIKFFTFISLCLQIHFNIVLNHLIVCFILNFPVTFLNLIIISLLILLIFYYILFIKFNLTLFIVYSLIFFNAINFSNGLLFSLNLLNEMILI